MMTNRELVEYAKHVEEIVAVPEALWTVIYRHPEHLDGQWHHDLPLFETREQAARDGHERWDGTSVEWRVMSIPLAGER